MENLTVPMNDLLARLDMARLFDSEKVGAIKTKLRKTSMYEASIYLSDGGKIYINGKLYPLKKYDIRFNRPGDMVYSVPHFKCLTVHFYFGDELNISNQVLDNIPEFFCGNSKIMDIFEKIMISVKMNDEVSGLLINSLLLKLIAEFYIINNPRKTYSDTVAKCIAYINQHFSSKINLDTLGVSTGYSPLHLSRKFLSETGKTPHEYLTELRIEHAKQKLAESNITINELSVQCGFSSESHFKTLFKRLTGKTPGAYRKEMRMSI